MVDGEMTDGVPETEALPSRDGEMVAGNGGLLGAWEAAGRPWVDPLPAADDEPDDWRLPWPEGQKTVLRCPILTMRRAEALIRVGHLDYARWFLFEQKHAAAPAIRSLDRRDWDTRLDRCLAELARKEEQAKARAADPQD